jgi:hypothetical protein
MWDLFVSETRKGNARDCGSWAGPRRREREAEEAGSTRRSNSEGRKEQAGSGGPPSRRAAGKLFFSFFYICFPNHLNRFSNPNQIKSKPHHTIKQTSIFILYTS